MFVLGKSVCPSETPGFLTRHWKGPLGNLPEMVSGPTLGWGWGREAGPLPPSSTGYPFGAHLQKSGSFKGCPGNYYLTLPRRLGNGVSCPLRRCCLVSAVVPWFKIIPGLTSVSSCSMFDHQAHDTEMKSDLVEISHLWQRTPSVFPGIARTRAHRPPRPATNATTCWSYLLLVSRRRWTESKLDSQW